MMVSIHKIIHFEFILLVISDSLATVGSPCCRVPRLFGPDAYYSLVNSTVLENKDKTGA